MIKQLDLVDFAIENGNVEGMDRYTGTEREVVIYMSNEEDGELDDEYDREWLILWSDTKVFEDFCSWCDKKEIDWKKNSLYTNSLVIGDREIFIYAVRITLF